MNGSLCGVFSERHFPNSGPPLFEPKWLCHLTTNCKILDAATSLLFIACTLCALFRQDFLINLVLKMMKAFYMTAFKIQPRSFTKSGKLDPYCYIQYESVNKHRSFRENRTDAIVFVESVYEAATDRPRSWQQRNQRIQKKSPFRFRNSFFRTKQLLSSHFVG